MRNIVRAKTGKPALVPLPMTPEQAANAAQASAAARRYRALQRERASSAVNQRVEADMETIKTLLGHQPLRRQEITLATGWSVGTTRWCLKRLSRAGLIEYGADKSWHLVPQRRQEQA